MKTKLSLVFVMFSLSAFASKPCTRLQITSRHSNLIEACNRIHNSYSLSCANQLISNNDLPEVEDLTACLKIITPWAKQCLKMASAQGHGMISVDTITSCAKVNDSKALNCVVKVSESYDGLNPHSIDDCTIN